MASVMSSRTPRSGRTRPSNPGLSARSRNTPSARQNAAEQFVSRPQETPLDREALLALESLQRNAGGIYRTALQESHADISNLVNHRIEDMYDRLFDERRRYQNRVKKAKDNDETEEEIKEAKAIVEAFQAKVSDYDSKLDQCLREVIDDKEWIKTISASVKHVKEKSKDAQAVYEERAQATREAHPGVDEDGDQEEQSMPKLDVSDQATTLLAAAVSTAEDEWNAKSLTEKYSKDKIYEDFYGLRWAAQHPEEHPPPRPAPSMWFASEEGRGGKTQATQIDDQIIMEDAEDDTELQIASERMSYKCPLSIQWFTDPVTSTKCPHSFEKNAIREFISQSSTHAPLSAEQIEELNERHPPGSRGRPAAEASALRQNKKCAKCPECSVELTLDDLKDNPVLLRMSRKAQEAEKNPERDDEDSDENDEYESMTQRPGAKRTVVQVGSSPASSRRRPLIKGERRSVVPNSQIPTHESPTRRQIADIGAEDDSDEDMTG